MLSLFSNHCSPLKWQIYSFNEIASRFVLTLREQILGLRNKRNAIHDNTVSTTRTFEWSSGFSGQISAEGF
jgi:hypothetical protein